MENLRLAKRLCVFAPSGTQVDDLIDRARTDLPGLADGNVVRRVMTHNPDAVWAIARRERFDAAAPTGEGFVGFLMLNEAGVRALMKGTLDASNPDLALLTGQNERPAGIYWWVCYAPGALAAGVPLAFEKVWSRLYGSADIFARAVTDDGHRFLDALGFKRGAIYDGLAAPHLHHFRRTEASEDLPLYDTYRGGHDESTLSVTVAQSLTDIMKVISIRSAVYLGEQECPYEEEFDGNDFSATHLIGYVGDEPASCLRIRCFADFAKIERLAVRREFRKNKLAYEIVRAAMEFCRVKGYRRMYGHAQKRLTRFWSQFGFEVFEGSQEFVFSDFDYVEMAFNAERHPQAITIGVDPYVIIRPEGRWHRPGILERSARRPVTQPSITPPRVERKRA